MVSALDLAHNCSERIGARAAQAALSPGRFLRAFQHMNTVLICTVGGSHQPVVTAIRRSQPSHVVFVCTDTDAATGKPGSRTQIEGLGHCIKEKSTDAAPTLPNIPTQCELAEGSWELLVVPADDLDEAYRVLRRALCATRESWPEARVIADYTGGTKSMTGALILAALDERDVTLQFVTGARQDLVKVRDGTQAPTPAAVDAIRLQRDMAPFLSAWSRYAYEEAAAGLDALPAPADRRLRADWQRARDLSAAFAAWDRFDHAGALSMLAVYERASAPLLGSLYRDLKLLARGHEDPAAEGLRLWDLWLNAHRRAAAGRYDDAVARSYRLLEWTAQWVLRTEKGWQTGDLPPEVGTAAGFRPGDDGKFQAGLFAAWSLVRSDCQGPAAAFFAAHEPALRDHISRRNRSILAHGHTPIDQTSWSAFCGWLEQHFTPVLREMLSAHRIRQPFGQLPDRYIFQELVP
jgi:CRISPR-associated protein (TIGR02710 family)